MNLKTYEEKLQLHDWYYQMSDDHSVWKKGKAAHDELMKLSELSPKHKALFIKYGSKYSV